MPSLQRQFWRHAPVDTDDPDLLHRFGLDARSRDDGRGMMATGWTLAVMSAASDGRWFDYLRAGFEVWRAAPGYEPALGRRFLEQLVAELGDDSPARPAPGIPSDDGFEAVDGAARCWAVGQLLELTVEPVMEQRLYRIVTGTPRPFVPVASVAWASDFAARHDLPSPWSA